MIFSVVIATKDRPESLLACLDSFRSLEYPAGEWELILVNDGGKTSFAGIADVHRRSLPLRLLEAPRSGGPGYARNLGARAAGGRYLAFTDDDCRVAPDWLHAFEHVLRKEEWDAAGGLSLNPYPGNTAGEAWNVLIAFLYDYWRDDRGNVVMVVSNNAIVKRDVFLEMNGFDESFLVSEDREFSFRLIASGRRQTFCPEARVWHHQIAPTAWRYLRTQFRYGRGGARFHRKIKRLGSASTVTFKPQGPRFYPYALWSWLIRRNSGLPLTVLITLGQIAHRTGRYAERLRFWIRPPR